jgi:hypothetical protein
VPRRKKGYFPRKLKQIKKEKAIDLDDYRVKEIGRKIKLEEIKSNRPSEKKKGKRKKKKIASRSGLQIRKS